VASSWNKVKELFWQAGEPAAGAEPSGSPAEELSDAEFAEMLAASPHAVPPAQSVEPVTTVNVALAGDPAHVTIDFQAQYDLAGIPDTDEVEQLENFLSRLDSSLPNASKLAAAQAFLGAIGKARDDVLGDAARKIQRVRGIVAGKEQEVAALLTEEQAQITALERQIEAHRQRMEALNRELEGVRHACLVEESRLQAARVFFGNVEPGGS
jgi:hypothetical protein